MDTLTIFLGITGALISWVILYYVVKAAVKNGIRETRSDKEVQTLIRTGSSERLANPAQLKLQQQYDKGEINFEEFKSQWNKVGN
ncbi:MAG TPA: DUF6019 family protein [Panacibacter sp.]|nr:DUF6019 family protein [Panacibacter sp.]HNP46998.1 DUF6019 family protein [Panacibacter sp.]